jgi:ribulose kinase
LLWSQKNVDRFEEEGVKIEKVIGIGGVARKSPFIMQTLANVLNMPIVVAASDQAPALGQPFMQPLQQEFILLFRKQARKWAPISKQNISHRLKR